MIIDAVVVGGFQENCYLVGDDRGGEAVVIDPGDEVEQILEKLGRHSLTCKAIVHTHAHIDHCMASAALQKATQAHCYVPLAEREIWGTIPMQARMFGMPGTSLPPVDTWVKDGDVVRWGKSMSLEVINTPGHTPGGVTYRLKREKESDVLFVGDALFCGSIGRTDLLGGDHEQLISSIKNRLMTFPDDTIVLTGHGPATTIGQERKHNPFLQANAYF
jgi:glyoxylase-like metal-dependent hydrolase (beta-lactamase superfamily II)